MRVTKRPSLTETHPEIASEADGWDPSLLSPGSNKRLGWICKKGHQWRTQVNNRTKVGSRCPYCTGRKAITGENDLATAHPELAAQADGWDPTKIGGGSGRNLSWKCDLGQFKDKAARLQLIFHLQGRVSLNFGETRYDIAAYWTLF